MTTLVIGVGSAGGGDDAVGLVVAEQVLRQGLTSVRVVATDAPASLLDLWDEDDDVVLVDAVRSGARPGTVTTSRLGSRTMAARAGARGTHGFGIAEVVDLARALDRLPRSLTLVGVEVGALDQGGPLSPAVLASLAEAEAAVLAALHKAQVATP